MHEKSPDFLRQPSCDSLRQHSPNSLHEMSFSSSASPRLFCSTSVTGSSLDARSPGRLTRTVSDSESGRIGLFSRVTGSSPDSRSPCRLLRTVSDCESGRIGLFSCTQSAAVLAADEVLEQQQVQQQQRRYGAEGEGLMRMPSASFVKLKTESEHLPKDALLIPEHATSADIRDEQE